MGKDTEALKFYTLALIAPLGATVLGFVILGYLHHSNITLIYLLAVLIVAVRTSIVPALICAISGFLMYNFFFTEPRYSFVIFHREDFLTVVLFLLTATLAGQQAARLRQQVFALQTRSEFAKIQLDFLEQLAGNVDNHQVFIGLYSVLSEIRSVTCFLAELAENDIKVTVGTASLDQADISNIRKVFSGKNSIISGINQYYPLHDGVDTVAVVGIKPDYNWTRPNNISSENIEMLVTQASLVLGRTRLARDLEKERVEKERELLRSTLLTSVSHDLRTPLSSMIGSASSLLELGESLSEAQKKELLETILQEASRLDGYIQNLLDMTRLGYRGLRLERDWIGLDEILSIVMRRIKPLSQGHNIEIIISPDLPLLYVHAALIEQAIYNVVENAVKFSPIGSAIVIRTTLQQGFVVVDVIDSGPGIPESEREQIFDMFHTVNRKDQHVAGTGLGLAISKGMIGAHGGKLEVFDNPDGEGTLFRFSIPVNSSKEPDKLEGVL